MILVFLLILRILYEDLENGVIDHRMYYKLIQQCALSHRVNKYHEMQIDANMHQIG